MYMGQVLLSKNVCYACFVALSQMGKLIEVEDINIVKYIFNKKNISTKVEMQNYAF